MMLRNSRYGLFWGCSRFPECRSTHGAHPDGRPLGKPATAEVKQARIAAHAAFDRLWKGGGMRRSDAYRWLTQAMGRTQQMLMGEMDAAECAEVVRLVSEKLPTLGNRKARRAAFDKTSRRAFMAAAKNERK